MFVRLFVGLLESPANSSVSSFQTAQGDAFAFVVFMKHPDNSAELPSKRDRVGGEPVHSLLKPMALLHGEYMRETKSLSLSPYIL